MSTPGLTLEPRRRPCTRPVWLERGSVSIQMVILMPALFSLMFLGVQGALMYQARTLTLAAAQEGARAAAAWDSTAQAGISTAESVLGDSPTGISNVVVTGTRSGTQASVTVSVTTPSVIPGWDPNVTQSASMPVERITQ